MKLIFLKVEEQMVFVNENLPAVELNDFDSGE